MIAASALALTLPMGTGGAAFGQAEVQPVSPDEPPLQVQPSVEPVPSVDRAPAAQQPVAASAGEASEPEPYSRAWLEALRERVLADVRADIARAGREAFPPRDGGELADLLLNTPDPARLRAYHDLLAGMPHDAGTEGDAWTIETLGLFFDALGLAVERHEIDVLLSRPERAEVRVFAPDVDASGLELALRENAVEGDRFSATADARRGWNAYSGSGAVRGRVVYANYGTLEDFDRLRELGVDLNGAIVLARYGRNFRGYKARFAEAAGAGGLLMYTDPADAGWGRGLSWPEGGWANDSHIQRGSLKTAPYPGDVLTPFEPSVEGVARQNPERVELPRIPVQPISWAAASEILSRMNGRTIEDNAWQGGLPLRYRLEGGADLRVSMDVSVPRERVQTANVVGVLRGSVEPDRLVVVGCHHDAWGYGAGDATSGMIALLESARSFAIAKASGVVPRRSIAFAGWGAEEHGIVGSVEWVEQHAERLLAGGVAYINLDMASMGTDFGASASPSLRAVIAEAAASVPQPAGNGRSVLEAWGERGGLGATDLPVFGDLGGGSDHVGFLCHVCVPSASLRAGGARGVAYHSIYDNLDWYRAVVGDDYESALMIARMTNGVVARLAHDAVLPLEPGAYAEDVSGRLARFVERAERGGMVGAASTLRMARERVAQTAALGGLHDALAAAGTPADVDALNRELLALERGWCGAGLDTQRPWYRNRYAAPDPFSGYSAWILPDIELVLHPRGGVGEASIGSAVSRVEGWVDRLGATLGGLGGAEALVPVE